MEFQNIKILVVDDELTTRKLISSIIEMQFKSEVLTAANPKEAFEILNNTNPDLLILDMQMPVMDGYTFLVHLRSLSKFKKLPVIPCTALSSKQLLVNLIKLDISDYIVKPILKDSFISKLNNTLQSIAIKKNLDETTKEYL